MTKHEKKLSLRAALHSPATLGDKVADAVTKGMGSWWFLIIQNVLIALWMIGNSIPGMPHLDPFPFIFLNLALSWQAANASPIIMKSQNRQADKDRARDDLEAQEVGDLAGSHAILLQLNRQQLQILEQQSIILSALQSAPPRKRGGGGA